MNYKLRRISLQLLDIQSKIDSIGSNLSKIMKKLPSSVDREIIAVHSLRNGLSVTEPVIKQATTCYCTFTWKAEIQSYIHMVRMGKPLSLYSPPFYTSRQGYKACLRLYMNGDGCGKSTHLCLFFVIMRGEYDTLLQWPIRLIVSLTLLDQHEDKQLKSKSITFSVVIQRPMSNVNIASGCLKFSLLNSSAHIKDSTMIFQCSVIGL